MNKSKEKLPKNQRLRPVFNGRSKPDAQYQVAELEVSYTPTQHESSIKISGSGDAYRVLKKMWDKSLLAIQEQFCVLYLKRNNEVIGFRNLCTGGASGVYVDIQLVFVFALKTRAQSIIIAHNHPSGSLKPSETDLRLTRQLADAGKLLEIKLLDHLIISSQNYASLADDGII